MTDHPAEPILKENLNDAMWRLSNLYWIVTKGDDEDDEGLVVKFVPNRAQRRLLRRMHNRNIILKARQLGFTTLIAILWLDTALFSKDPIRCVVIAHEREAAEDIFQSKVVFAYEKLPDTIRERMPLAKKTATELRFAHNGASIRVTSSARSGTTHRLHVSELGKIAAKYPAKAKEVVAGSIPSVPKSGITVIESTAEGQDGKFFDMTTQAIETAEKGRPLTVRDYRFHFFAWWEAPEYEIDPEGVHFTEAHLTYFNTVEAKIGRTLSDRKRAWYVATMRTDFADDQPLMWQEYPSYPEEAFAVSTEGCYYAKQLANARKAGRIRPGIPVEAVPVNTFWDIGRNDMTAIWMHQQIGPEDRFIGYYENSGEEFSHYVAELQKKGYVWGRHYLPHDAGIKRQGETPDTNRSPKEMLENLWPGQKFEIVPRISSKLTGIQQTRDCFASAWIDEVECAEGLPRLANYRKEWDKVRGRWKDEPLHDDNSNGADAFRQWAQAKTSGEKFNAPSAPVRSSAPSKRGRATWNRGRSSMSV